MVGFEETAGTASVNTSTGSSSKYCMPSINFEPTDKLSVKFAEFTKMFFVEGDEPTKKPPFLTVKIYAVFSNKGLPEDKVTFTVKDEDLGRPGVKVPFIHYFLECPKTKNKVWFGRQVGGTWKGGNIKLSGMTMGEANVNMWLADSEVKESGEARKLSMKMILAPNKRSMEYWEKNKDQYTARRGTSTGTPPKTPITPQPDNELAEGEIQNEAEIPF